MSKRQASRGRPATRGYAQQAEALLHAQGDYRHLRVRAHGAHLVVEHLEGDAFEPIARWTHLGGGTFGSSFRNHAGRWEPMPFAGPLERVIPNVAQALAPYLERWENPLGISGTGH
jgi:hypothetical protein